MVVIQVVDSLGCSVGMAEAVEAVGMAGEVEEMVEAGAVARLHYPRIVCLPTLYGDPSKGPREMIREDMSNASMILLLLRRIRSVDRSARGKDIQRS